MSGGSVEVAGRLRHAARGLAGATLRLLVHAYRVGLSPHLGGACRYVPSCSAYALEAIDRHGPWRGAALAVGRLLRCHPFRSGGFDPVPDPTHRGAGCLGGGPAGAGATDGP